MESASLAVASILVTVALAVAGYFINSSRRSIGDVERRSYHRHEDAKGLIVASETRSVQCVKDAEARSVERIKDAETRCEKSDARILETVNSQYSELRRDFRDGMKELRESISHIAPAGGH